MQDKFKLINKLYIKLYFLKQEKYPHDDIKITQIKKMIILAFIKIYKYTHITKVNWLRIMI